MNKQSKKITGLFSRYITILILGLGNLYIIYKILTPLTIYTTSAILSIFTTTSLAGNIIHLNSVALEIIPSCVAGSAFYLLIILLLSTGDISPETRTKAVFTAIGLFFFLNVIRIILLVPMISSPHFETAHWIFWHLVSTIFVVIVWILTIKIHEIRSVPIYTDFKFLKSLTHKSKKKTKKKK